MKKQIIRNYFISLEVNPLYFTNTLLSAFYSYGLPYSDFEEYEILEKEDFDIIIDGIIYTFNTLHKDNKLDEEKSVYFNDFIEDLPLIITILYLYIIENKYLPICLVNLKTLYELIQETFNQNGSVQSKSNLELNDLHEVLILSLTEKLEIGNDKKDKSNLSPKELDIDSDEPSIENNPKESKNEYSGSETLKILNKTLSDFDKSSDWYKIAIQRQDEKKKGSGCLGMLIFMFLFIGTFLLFT